VPETIVVFDCVVFLQSLIRLSGPAVTCIERFEQGRFSLVVSPEVLSELHDVLSRPKLRESFPLLTDAKTDRLIESLLGKGKFVANVPKRWELPRDPDDEPYINLAIEAGAQYLVTRDRDLLDLMISDSKEGREFQSQFPELRILDPISFLKAIE